ncbi:MAG: type II secretion system protein [Gammaproteobacteria bacterium]
MNDNTQRKARGFTLLEMLLVIAIASSIVVLMLNYTTQKSDELRRDKTVLQMQQLLNASMSFYVNNSFWPMKNATISAQGCGTNAWSDFSLLQPGYLPNSFANNPYANGYQINCNGMNGAALGGFYGITQVDKPANAAIIAGRLPLAFVTDTNTPGNPPTQSATCQASPTAAGCVYVVSTVSIPGQNLNNARSVNFAGVYSNGACVPAPNCPPNMKPAIMVTPTAVAGVTNNTSGDLVCTDPTDPATCTTIKTYPLNSFSAFARGVDIATGVPATSTGGSGAPISASPLDCAVLNTSTAVACDFGSNTIASAEALGTSYWRVCLVVFTENGEAYPVGPTPPSNAVAQGKLIGSIMAITRCVPNMGSESPGGSPITVWTPNASYLP